MSKDYWIFQYFTSCFLHGGISHLLFNMIGLLFFGVFIEKLFGRYKFLSLYLVSGVLANILFHIFYNPIVPSLGASGAIFGILTAVAIIKPNEKVYLYFIIPMKLWVTIGIILVYELYMTIFPSNGDMVAHFVHIMGALVGSLYYILLLRKHR